jgi:hypothetical protein
VADVFRPIPVEYAGLSADDSRVDALQLGRSLQGIARVSNSVVNFYLDGQIVDSRVYRTRMLLGPPKEGSLLFEIIAVSASGSLPLYFPVLCEIADLYVPKLISALIFWKTGHKMDTQKIVDQLVDLAKGHSEFAKDVHDGHLRDKEWLQSHIEDLTRKNTAPMRDLPDPVG